MHTITLTIPATGLPVDELLASLLGGLPVLPSGSLVLTAGGDGETPQRITFTGRREFLVALVYLCERDVERAHAQCRDIEELEPDGPPDASPLAPPRRSLSLGPMLD
jgi:hypothetical protein